MTIVEEALLEDIRRWFVLSIPLRFFSHVYEITGRYTGARMLVTRYMHTNSYVVDNDPQLCGRIRFYRSSGQWYSAVRRWIMTPYLVASFDRCHWLDVTGVVVVVVVVVGRRVSSLHIARRRCGDKHCKTTLQRLYYSTVNTSGPTLPYIRYHYHQILYRPVVEHKLVQWTARFRSLTSVCQVLCSSFDEQITSSYVSARLFLVEH